MCQPSLSVWFVCRLCRGSFGQVDAFIEHKKQKHFNEFKNTTSIVFEETGDGFHDPLHPVMNGEDHELADEINDLLIKIEMYHEDPISCEIIDEPNLHLVEPKIELITFECEKNPENEDNFFGVEQPEQNPYVLLKRLTKEETERACVPPHHSTLLKCEQKIVASSSKPPNSLGVDSNINDHIEVEKSTEIQPTTSGTVKRDLQFECKLCSKQLESEPQLKIHVGICVLHHKDRNRFCVKCNKTFSDKYSLDDHRLRFHGTKEEKLSLYKFKCHLCPKKYQRTPDLRFHLETHKRMKQEKTSKSKPFKCSHTNCVAEFRLNYDLQRHIAAVHLGLRPFSCDFPNCNKHFSRQSSLNVHLRIHTGDHLFKCTVDNCNRAFTTSQNRSSHHRRVHCNL